MRNLIPSYRGQKKTDVAIFSALFLLIALALFPKFFLGEHVIGPVDLIYNYAPWKYQNAQNIQPGPYTLSDQIDKALPELIYMTDRIKEGVIPHYTHSIQNGTPLFWTIKNEIKIVPLLLFTLLFPFSIGISLYFIFKIYIAGLFMFLFVRKYKASGFGSVLAGLAYSFSSPSMQNFNLLINFEYMIFPVCMYGFYKVFCEASKLWLGLLPLFISQLILAGYPTIAGYFIAFLFTYGATLVIARHNFDSSFYLDITKLSCIGVFSLLIASPALLASVDFFSNFDWEYRTNYWRQHIPQKWLINYIFPFFHGTAFEHQWIRLAEYVGLLPLIFSLRGILTLTRKHIYFYAVFTFIMVMAYNLGGLIYFYQFIPVFNASMSNNLMVTIPFFMCFFMAQGASEQIDPPWLNKATFTLAIALLSAVILYALLNYPASQLFDHPRAGFQWILIALAPILTWLALKNYKPKITIPLLLFVVSADLFNLARDINTTIPKSAYFSSSPGIRFLQENLGFNKLFMFERDFIANTPQAFNLPTISGRGFYSKRSKAMYRLIDPLAFKGTPTQHIFPLHSRVRFENELFDALGLKYITAPLASEPTQLARQYVARQTEWNSSVNLVPDSPIRQAMVSQVNTDINFLKVRIAENTCVTDTPIEVALKGLKEQKEHTLTVPAGSVGWTSVSLSNKASVKKGSKISLQLLRLDRSPCKINLSSVNFSILKHGDLIVNGDPSNSDLTFMIYGESTPLLQEAEKFEVVYNNEMLIWRNKQAYPRAWLVSKVEPLSDKQFVENAIADKLNYLTTAYIDPKTIAAFDLPILAQNQPTNRSVQINKLNENNHVFTVDEGPLSILIISDNYDQHWKAKINGKKATVMEVNYHMRGLLIPPEASRVEVMYKPEFLKKGYILALIGLLLSMGFPILCRFWASSKSKGKS